MASFRKRRNVWIADVCLLGTRKSKSFINKKEAYYWAVKTEARIIEQAEGSVPDKTLGDLLARYAEEVSPTKKGERWEVIRINRFIQQDELAQKKLRYIQPSDFAEWRDARLKSVSASSVSREMTLLHHVCKIAVDEWQWLEFNPLAKIRQPKRGKPRDRRISQDEEKRILRALNYRSNRICRSTKDRVACAFLFALETAMRMGEILKLKWENIDIKKRVATLIDTKNGTDRKVPLSVEAVRLLKQLPVCDTVFDLNSNTLSIAFRQAKKQAKIENLHFHDTRHEAITRLAKKIPVLDLARIVGHRDIKMLMIYYNITAEELARKL